MWPCTINKNRRYHVSNILEEGHRYGGSSSSLFILIVISPVNLSGDQDPQLVILAGPSQGRIEWSRREIDLEIVSEVSICILDRPLVRLQKL